MTDDEKFAKWWFVAGGGIHGAWKRRRWSDLKRLAENLPKAAWAECAKQADEKLKIAVETLEQIGFSRGSDAGSLNARNFNAACEALARIKGEG